MKSAHKKILLFIVLAFSINLVWEVSHSVLYDWNQSPLQNNVGFYVPKILYSTFGDLLFLMAIFAVVSLRNRNLKWLENPRKTDYFGIATLGFIVAFLIELRALKLHWWTYNSMMPTIFGFGLTPIIQLALTGIFVLWLLGKK